MDMSGNLTILHTFGMDAAYPKGGVLQARDGYFYGIAGSGSAGNARWVDSS